MNFDVDADPNNYAIGIETLGFGSKVAGDGTDTDAMYQVNRTLVQGIASRHGIPVAKGRIVGHENGNPMARFGWDLAPGFDWKRVYP